MSSEEIIIKTETVKVEDLKGREKQIYDYAYKKGFEAAIDRNQKVRASIISNCVFLAFFVFGFVLLFIIR